MPAMPLTRGNHEEIYEAIKSGDNATIVVLTIMKDGKPSVSKKNNSYNLRDPDDVGMDIRCQRRTRDFLHLMTFWKHLEKIPTKNKRYKGLVSCATSTKLVL